MITIKACVCMQNYQRIASTHTHQRLSNKKAVHCGWYSGSGGEGYGVIERVDS